MIFKLLSLQTLSSHLLFTLLSHDIYLFKALIMSAITDTIKYTHNKKRAFIIRKVKNVYLKCGKITISK